MPAKKKTQPKKSVGRPRKSTTVKLNAGANGKRLQKAVANLDGLKYDAGKPRMDLIPPYIEEEVAKVLTFGAEKYGPNNWQLVDEHEARYTAAALRHINAMKKGETVDPESGLLHAAHAICCLMFIGDVELRQ